MHKICSSSNQTKYHLDEEKVDKEPPPNWESICGWCIVASGIGKILNLSVILHAQASYMPRTSWP